MEKVYPKLTVSSIEAWERGNEAALLAAFDKAARDVKLGKGTVFDPMKPRALLKLIVNLPKRRRAA